MPALHVLAGSNGAGKSTFVREVLQPVAALPFINADEIAADRWPGDEERHAYEASAAAAAARDAAFEARRSFITETVFSHPSKVDLIREASGRGYFVSLHVILVPEEVTVGRVLRRVEQGGHTVPEEKIRQRYQRLWALVAEAQALTDNATFYDNSSARTPFVSVASFAHGQLLGTSRWPAWAPAELKALG